MEIQVTVENHVNTFCETPGGACRLLDWVPGLGLAFDPSHMIMQDQDLSPWTLLFPRVRHVRIRDASDSMMQSRMGMGKLKPADLLDMPGILSYSGILIVEHLRPSQSGAGEYDIKADIGTAREAAVKALGGMRN